VNVVSIERESIIDLFVYSDRGRRFYIIALFEGEVQHIQKVITVAREKTG